MGLNFYTKGRDSMRKIEYTVDIDGISPDSAQYGGIQGEHRATELAITLTEELCGALSAAAVGGSKIYCRISSCDGAGVCRSSEVSEVDLSGETAQVGFDVEQYLTAAGGTAELRVIFTAVKDGEPERVIYSYPIRLRFDSSRCGSDGELSDAREVSAAVVQAATFAGNAEKSASAAQSSAAAAESSAESAAQSVSSAQAASNAAADSAASAAQAAANAVNGNAVKFSAEQELSDAQKALARKNIGAVSSSDVSSATDAATQHVVSAGERQNFTDEQKAQARFNIGAVDASKVKSSLSAHDDIPNARAMADYVDDTVKHTAVMISEQSLSDEQKSTARENIGAVAVDNVVLKSTDKPDTDASELIYSITGVQRFLYKNTVLSTIDQSASEVANWTDTKKAQARKNIDVDGGKWVLLRTYTTDGVNKAFGDGTTSNAGTTTTDVDGNALSLSAVSVVFKNTAAAAANSYAALFAYTASGENEYGGYSVSTNAVNTKENAQGVMTVFADRGYYRSLSIDGALKNSAYARENPSQAFVMTSDSVINQIKFVLGAIPPADDIIEIWGIKA